MLGNEDDSFYSNLFDESGLVKHLKRGNNGFADFYCPINPRTKIYTLYA